ncbi:class I SAM-dependent methyltransferase [Emcibacter sp. SYSU 3D8]|uniref:class I SAM-dependent methyltransferase n=1 Tax=Emcibacter sp. SYSU 3D8 TaxID=3133969 RepID=UPI0031FEC54B
MTAAAHHQCMVCGGETVSIVTTAIGERAYCRNCFHGWRLEAPSFEYSTVAMCSMVTTLERQESQAAFIAPFLNSEPRILEIGCAGGELAATLRRAFPGCWYEAVEPSPMAEKAMNHVDRLHTRPLDRLLADREVGDNFDLIVMSHLLEHLPDPQGVIQSLSGLLSPGGTLFLEVPNRSGHRGLPLDDNISHLHFFSPSSLLRLLSNGGFEAQAVATGARLDARYADSLRIMARRFAPPQPDRTLLSADPAFAHEGSIVVWGAGSVALEVLANFLDPAKIDFFIDKNPAKYGSMCLGKLVKAPAALGSTPRTILIASVDFGEEISREILRLYPDAGHRLILVSEILDRGLDGIKR